MLRTIPRILSDDASRARIHLPPRLQMADAVVTGISAIRQDTRILLGLLRLGALRRGTAKVVRDPGLVVVLVDTAGDAAGLVAGQRLSNVDDLALLGGTGSLLGLGEESLDPGLVDEVQSATKDASQEEVEEDTVGKKSARLSIDCRSIVEPGQTQKPRNVHLGVKNAGRRLDNAGQAAVSFDLEGAVLLVTNNGDEVENNILRLHVESERERQGAGLAGSNIDIIAQGRQVAEDAGRGGSILGQWLRGREHAADKDEIDGTLLMVGDLDDRPGRVAVHELDAKVRVGEGRLDVDVQLWGLDLWSFGILRLVDEQLSVSRRWWQAFGRARERPMRALCVRGWWNPRLTSASAAKTETARRARRARVDSLRRAMIPVRTRGAAEEKGSEGE